MEPRGEDIDAKAFVAIVSDVGKDDTVVYFGKDDPISWWIKKRDDWEDEWFIWHNIHPELWHRMTGLPALTSPPPLPDPFSKETDFDSVIRILKKIGIGENTTLHNDKGDEAWVVAHDAGGYWGVQKYKRARKD